MSARALLMYVLNDAASLLFEANKIQMVLLLCLYRFKTVAAVVAMTFSPAATQATDCASLRRPEIATFSNYINNNCCRIFIYFALFLF